MDFAEYKAKFDEESAPGWEAINEPLEALYGPDEWKHWGTILRYSLGGPDPLDGVSVYQSTEGGIDHLHFITFGYTNLYYDEDVVGEEYSKFGFEMTFRLKSDLPPAEDPNWVVNLLQNLARYVYDSGKWFTSGHWINANGPIRADFDTDIVGLGFLFDPQLDPIDTPHGRVEFVQAFGLTQSELDALSNKTKTCEEIIDTHRQTNALLVTDLARKDGD